MRAVLRKCFITFNWSSVQLQHWKTEYNCGSLLCCIYMWLTFTSLDETLVCDQMKAIELYFHVVLFIMLFRVTLPFKSLVETLVCDH